MASEKPAPLVSQFRPRASTLEALIRKLAAGAISPSFGVHAIERMEERAITTLDVLRVLRVGSIKGEIEAGRSAGEWKCKVVAKIKGSREVGVVTVVMSQGKLFVKTVEWEDL